MLRNNSLPIALLFAAHFAFAGVAEGSPSTDEYVRGRDLYLSLSPENMPAAIEHLQRAIALDPTNLRAWYTLSDAYRTGMLMVKADARAWKEEAQKTEAYLLALSTDPGRAAAHDRRVLAEFDVRLRGKIAVDSGDWTRAEAILRRNMELEAASELSKGRDISYGTFLLSVGRIKEAALILERARRADRYAGVVYSHLARARASMNEYERSLAILDEGMNLFSEPEAGIEQRWHPLLRRTALLTALATRDKRVIGAKARHVKNADLGAGELDNKLAALLYDDRAMKRSLHEMWADPVNRFGYRAESVAHWAAYAGEYDLAFAALKGLPSELATWVLWHPAMTQARDRPGFREAVKQLGLVDYWRASGNWGEFCRSLSAQEFECGVASR